jgi:hypothetical protein
MAGVGNPLAYLFPTQENLIPPNYNLTSGSWITVLNGTEQNPFFRAQMVQCSYQISGGYGLTPRIILYVLATIAVLWRNTKWAVDAALAAVMVYSSSAAVHAVVLVAIRRQMVPKYVTDNWQAVLVAGTTETGRLETASTAWNSPVWFPVLPMSWDSDGDPVLDIVGSTFLLLLPMQIWSRTFEQAGPVQKRVVFAWGLLLLIGLISALVNEAYVDEWSFPQLRFCPNDQEDTLPILNSGVDSVAGVWDRLDWYHWNRTVQDYLIYKNLSVHPPNTCLYPCFDFDWPLRDSSDITVTSFSYGSASEGSAAFTLLVLLYLLIALTGTSNLTILVLKMTQAGFGREDFQPVTAFRNYRDAIREILTQSWSFRVITRTWILLTIIYGYFVGPLAVVYMVAYMEWMMKNSDPGGESFRHVGQWGALVGTILVVAVAIAPVVFKRIQSYFQRKYSTADNFVTQQGPGPEVTENVELDDGPGPEKMV